MLASTQARIPAGGVIDRVQSALNLAVALERPPQSGTTCYVVPLAEQPQGNVRTAGPALQSMIVTVGILLAVRVLNDPLGERGSLRLELARDAVRDALYGWTPDHADAPYLLAESELYRMIPGTLWWLDRFTTSRRRRATQ